MIRKILVLSLSILVLGGCGTITTLIGEECCRPAPWPVVYGGTHMNTWVLANGGSVLPTLLDLYLSFVLDTLLLPITIPLELLR